MNIRSALIGTAATAALLMGMAGCGSPNQGDGATPQHSIAATPMSTTSGAPSAGTGSGSMQPGTESAHPATAALSIKDFKYEVPAAVQPGTKITVTNDDSVTHTVTAKNDGGFDVTVKGNGGTATFAAPSKPGSYAIICKFHANMSGTLVVK